MHNPQSFEFENKNKNNYSANNFLWHECFFNFPPTAIHNRDANHIQYQLQTASQPRTETSFEAAIGTETELVSTEVASSRGESV